MKFSVLLQPVDLLKLMLDSFCTSTIQDRELTEVTSSYTFNIGTCHDTCEPICFKVGMMLINTKLYSLISV